MRQPDIDLHIEELVLHGFAPGERYRIGAAIERELARLLTEQGAPEGLLGGREEVSLEGIDVPNLSLGSFQIQQGAKPEMIGMQVAQALYKGMRTGMSHASTTRTAQHKNVVYQSTQAQSEGGTGR